MLTNSLNNLPLPLGGLGPITPLMCSAVSLQGDPVPSAVKCTFCKPRGQMLKTFSRDNILIEYILMEHVLKYKSEPYVVMSYFGPL